MRSGPGSNRFRHRPGLPAAGTAGRTRGNGLTSGPPTSPQTSAASSELIVKMARLSMRAAQGQEGRKSDTR